jgi:dicarboxylate transporter 10
MTAASGFVSAIVCSPSDIANICMQNVRTLPPAIYRNYRHVFNAWVQKKSTEGWGALVQGVWLNCDRCPLVTCSQLASSDVLKGVLSMTGSNGEHPVLHVSASLLASLVATTLASLMDLIKTQLMVSSSQGSSLKDIRELTRLDGLRWLFRGWTPWPLWSCWSIGVLQDN